MKFQVLKVLYFLGKKKKINKKKKKKREFKREFYILYKCVFKIIINDMQNNNG